MPNNLESTIHDIVVRTASDMAKQIAQAVRQSIAAAIAGGDGTATAPAPQKRRGRPPGRKRAAAPVATAAAPASAAPAVAAKPVKRRKGSKRRLITAAELSQVLGVLDKKPGLTSIEIQKEAGIDAKQAARVLNKLRLTGKVKWKGERSRATYTVA